MILMNRIYTDNIIRKNNRKKLVNNYSKFITNNDINDVKMFILTTAINRPDLHKISFENYKKIIPTNLEIEWIINLDFVNFSEDLNPECELEKSKTNIENIFNDMGNLKFTFILNKKGNFNKAVRNLTDVLSKRISKNCQAILYLEDDWFFFKETKTFNLVNLIEDKYDFIKLHDDGDPFIKLSFQPSLIKPFVWYFMFYQKLKNDNDETKDPEKICQLLSDVKRNGLQWNKVHKFKDIGRDIEMNDSNTIRGWSQKNGEDNISLGYIYIDRLIKSIIYLIYKKEETFFNLKKLIKDELDILFNDSINDKILLNFESNKKSYFNFFEKICKLKKNKNKLTLKEIYYDIDRLSETGA